MGDVKETKGALSGVLLYAELENGDLARVRLGPHKELQVSQQLVIVPAAGSQPVQGGDDEGAPSVTKPVHGGGRANHNEPTEVNHGAAVSTQMDKTGKQVVLEGAVPEETWWANVGPLTDNSPLTMTASAGATRRYYLTWVVITNQHASVETVVTIRDAIGNVLIKQSCGIGNSGFALRLPNPPYGAKNQGLQAICATTGASVYISCGGYKGA